MATPYMAHICEVVKEFNEANQKLHGYANQFTNCYDWFVDALQHCTDLVFSSQSTLTGWVFQKALGIGLRFFSKTPYSTELASDYIKIDPFKLRRNECNQLFAGVSRDYIGLASKYLISLNLNIFFGFCIFMWLILLYLILRHNYIPMIFRRRKRRTNQSSSSPSSSTTALSLASSSDTSSYVSFPTPRPMKLKDKIIARYAIRPQRIDQKNVHVIFDLYHTPTILAQIMKKPITDVFHCLNPSQPLAENIHDGVFVKLLKTDKFNRHLIKKTFKSRLMLEIELDITKDNEVNVRCSRIRNVKLLVNRNDLTTNETTTISAGYEDRQITLNYDHLRAIEEGKYDEIVSYSEQERKQHMILQRKEEQQQLMIQRQEQQQLMLQWQEQQQQLMLQRQEQQQQLMLHRQDEQQQLMLLQREDQQQLQQQLLQREDQQQQQQLQERRKQQQLMQQQQRQQDQQLLQHQQQQQQLRQRRRQQQLQPQQQPQQLQQQQPHQQQRPQQQQQQRRRIAAGTTSLLPKSSSMDVDVISKSPVNTEKRIMNNLKTAMTASSGPPKPMPRIPSPRSPTPSSTAKNTGAIPKRPTTLRSATQFVTPQYSPRAPDVKKSRSDSFCSREPMPLKKLKDSNLFTIKDIKKKPNAGVQGTEQIGGKSDKKNWKY